MRRMISVVARRLAARRSVSGRDLVGDAERLADADRDVAAGMRQLLALRPDAVRARRSRPGRSARRSAGRGPRPRRGPPGARRRGLRVPSGKTNRTWPSSRIRFASRNASTSAPSRSTGWTPPLAATQPTIGQSNSSFLPSQWIRRPSRGISHEPMHDRVEVGGVVGGDDQRPLARDLIDRALDADPAQRPAEDPAAEGERRDERGDRAVDRVRSGCGRRRRRGPGRRRRSASSGGRRRLARRRPCRASASRMAPTTASTVSSKRLPSVAMIRASSARTRGARRHGSCRARRAGAAPRGSRRPRARSGRGRAPRRGAGPAPRPTRRGRS